MSLFFRSRQSEPMEARSSYSLKQLGIQIAQQASAGGPSVSSIDQAIRDAATWACVKVKASGIAMLPIDVVRYDGPKRISVPSPPVISRPGGTAARKVWTFSLAWSMFTDGNGFGLVTAIDAMARPSQINLLAPEQVTERKVVNGIAQAKVGGEVHKVYPHGDLWHVPGEVVAPGSPFGLSPIAYGSRATGTSLAAERFGGQFFDAGHPVGIIGLDGDPGEEQAKLIKQRILDITRGSREPLVLPKSHTYTKLHVDPKDSQFIDLMRFEVEQTCRRHGVPPSMVYSAVSGQALTYANVTQNDLQFLKYTLSFPIDLIEEALSDLLPAPRVVKFNRDAILEGDPKLREELNNMRLGNRTTTVNEVRYLNDLEGFGPEFDVPGIPPQPGAADPQGGAQ